MSKDFRGASNQWALLLCFNEIIEIIGYNKLISSLKQMYTFIFSKVKVKVKRCGPSGLVFS